MAALTAELSKSSSPAVPELTVKVLQNEAVNVSGVFKDVLRSRCELWVQSQVLKVKRFDLEKQRD